MTPSRKKVHPGEEALRLRLMAAPPAENWPELAILRGCMVEAGWFMSMRDRGDGIHFDVCWFWAKDWRRTGMEHGLVGSEPQTAYAAAVKGLSAPVPE